MVKRHKANQLFRVGIAAFIIAILIVAAIIKIIYPSPLLHEFFFIVSIFEIALAIAIAVFWERWKMWALLALVFATWGGYSLYAAIFGLPCLCLGVAVTLPHGTSLLVNIILVVLSWVVLKDLRITRQKSLKLALLSCICVIVGFAGASLLYYIRYFKL